ncbi:hypothetical protein ES703_107035 [subsurface metagenome]
MEIDVILIAKIVLLGLIHWMLVPLALQALIQRQRVLGGRKAPWAVAIVFITCLGSLLYLIFHPQTQTEAHTQTELW